MVILFSLGKNKETLCMNGPYKQKKNPQEVFLRVLLFKADGANA